MTPETPDTTEEVVRPARRSTSRGTRGARRAGMPSWARWAIGVPAVLVACLLLGTIVDVAAGAGRIHPGVRVGGVRVGGLTKAAAEARLRQRLEPKLGQGVQVRFEDQTWKLGAVSLGAVLEPGAAVEKAWAVGRDGRLGTSILQRAAAWVRPVDIPLDASLDESKLSAFLGLVGRTVDIAPTDATIEIEGSTARLVESHPGRAVDVPRLTSALAKAYLSDDRKIEVPTAEAPARVADADAQQALADTQMMLSDGVTIVYDKSTWEFGNSTIGKWIVFDALPARKPSIAASASAEATAGGDAESAGVERLVLVASVGSAEVSRTLLPKLGDVGRPAKNASFSVSNGVVSIVPHQDGVGPDLEALADELTKALKKPGPRAVELRTRRVNPAITTADAKKMGIRQRISTYTTTYESSNKPRVNNIHLLADALDGALVPPGGVFSFNGHVGERTAAKGYQEANAIVTRNGKLVLEPQLGGGICQMGTTVFNAVFFSGLPVVERHNHSFYISHYPKGRDATVSWGGPDFKFRNDTPNWVLIKTGYTRGSVTVSLYGTNPGYSVSYVTGTFTNVRPHVVETIEDPTLSVGLRKIEEGGVDGGTVLVRRIVSKGGSVFRTDSFTSVYKQKTETVRVGTKPLPSVPATGTAGG